MRCASLFFPGTFPPERLRRGCYVSGWDAPVAFEADASFVWPRELYREMVARFGPERFDDVDQFAANSPGWHARLATALCKRIERRVELGRWLLERERFDLFAIYFGESDTAAHHLWSLHDPNSPRRPEHVTPEEQDGLAQVYRSLDRAVAELLAAAGGVGVELTIVSDHGSGGASDKVVYLNRALEAAGLLRFRKRPWAAEGFAKGRELALTRLSPQMRERLFRGFGALLPGLVESRTRFAGIDMPNTSVFSDELNYFPALHYNLRGREPHGTVNPADVPKLRANIEQALYALRDPYTQTPVVRHVYAREELFHGPHVGRAPDLLLELALDRGYSYNLMPTPVAAENTAVFRQLAPHEYLGRKGRSLPGSHRDRGLFVAAGPSIRAVGEIDAAMADVSATLLARMQVAPPTELDGQVLTQALAPGYAARTRLDLNELPEGAPTSGASGAHPVSGNTARVEERLRRLGYIE
jgi:predicted AlkP superfamily phosphohydrolase/phosphomutase